MENCFIRDMPKPFHEPKSDTEQHFVTIFSNMVIAIFIFVCTNKKDDFWLTFAGWMLGHVSFLTQFILALFCLPNDAAVLQ